jgi:hypothetical protein
MSSSLLLIRIAVVCYFPLLILSEAKHWKKNTAFLRLIRPDRHPILNGLRFYYYQSRIAVWQKLIYDAFGKTFRHNDFSQVNELSQKMKEDNGLLLLGLHYGTMCSAFLLKQYNISPVILSLPGNIPDLSNTKNTERLSNDLLFKGTYEGFCFTGTEEKKFVEKMKEGQPGLIMSDVAPGNNRLSTPCLGVDYPINRFPFKLALHNAFPTWVIWFSTIKGKGFKLNVTELSFTTEQQGIEQYAAILSDVVKGNPYLWHSGNYLFNNHNLSTTTG